MKSVKVYVSSCHDLKLATVYVKWMETKTLQFEVVKDYKDADMVLFTGGTDINTNLYNNTKLSESQSPNVIRDMIETATFNNAVKDNKFILGICRGAQLCCALSGGYLIQDAKGHTISHTCIIKGAYKEDVMCVKTTSSHHQIMYPYNLLSTDYEIIAFSKSVGRDYKHTIPNFSLDLIRLKEPEVVHFKNTNALAIQGHPEWVDNNSPRPFKLFNLKLKLHIKKLITQHNAKKTNRTRSLTIV